MLKKFVPAFLTGLFILTGCLPSLSQNPQAAPMATSITGPAISLKDGLDRQVSLPAPARTIVSLAPANTEILYAIGAGAQVVGRDGFSDYPEIVKSVQDVGGSMGKYNIEMIVSLHPDLVLAGGINPSELVATLEKLGLTVYLLPNPKTVEDMFGNLEIVGKLTGHSPEAATFVKSLRGRVAILDEKIRLLSYLPTVYYELDASDPVKPFTAGPGSFMDMLIQRAGGVNIGRALSGEWAQISLEELLVQDPGIIILGDSSYGETPEKVAARPGYDKLTAIKNHQVFPFDDNLVSRPGPRWVDGLEALVKLLHPGLIQ